MVLKKVFDTASSLTEATINATTEAVSNTAQKVGFAQAADFVRETGKVTNSVTQAGLYVTSQLTDGAVKTVQGSMSQDTQIRQQGFDELKDTTKSIATSVTSMVQHSASHTYEAVAGMVAQDQQRVKAAAKSLLQTPLVGTQAFNISDIVRKEDFAHVDSIQSVNELYEGKLHPVTGVAFERTELLIGEQTISDVFPVFDAAFTARLKPEEYLLTDTEHDAIANEQLLQAIEQDAAVGQFINLTDEDIAGLQEGQTPAGYTWHHHEQPGVLQLVNAQIHAQTEHVGGRVLWGGGLERQ